MTFPPGRRNPFVESNLTSVSGDVLIASCGRPLLDGLSTVWVRWTRLLPQKLARSGLQRAISTVEPLFGFEPHLEVVHTHPALDLRVPTTTVIVSVCTTFTGEFVDRKGRELEISALEIMRVFTEEAEGKPMTGQFSKESARRITQLASRSL